jgi:type I restriction enzyme S subunit
MELRPGYKQSEVGIIPEEWFTSKVGDICGCIVPGRNKPRVFVGDIPWITTPDLENGKPVTTSRLGLCISRSEAKSVGSKVVPPGSVLMSCAGELGIVATTKNEIVVNQQLHAFIPSGRIEAMFLVNALAYQKDQIGNLGTKTAVPYLNKSACNSIVIPLPPPSEQRAIAEALSDIDALLGEIDKLIAKKRELKQAAMQQLLTGETRLPGFHREWVV